MIIDNTYFFGEIYIASAKPFLDSEDFNSELLNDFINQYSSECLLRCLGSEFYYEFSSKLDINEDNGLLPGIGGGWDHLLNGEEYNNPNGESSVWRGIRFKDVNSDKYRSFLAYYVYYFFQINGITTSTQIGEKLVDSKNAENANVSRKTSKSWNSFVDMVQDNVCKPKIHYNSFGYGLDYYQGKNKNKFVSLNRYMKDKIELGQSAFESYSPEIFDKINQLGI